MSKSFNLFSPFSVSVLPSWRVCNVKIIVYSFFLQEPQLTANEQFDVYSKPFSL